ncbi:MAG: Ig-like domain-containing protein [Spirochaetes bacterium]|nr:Ig-like domain-containing protein [Spirochaetota bacterium]
MKVITMIVSTLLFVISCNYFVDLEPPTIKRIEPANGSTIIQHRPIIFVEFSEEMDKPKTEEAFIIEGVHQLKGHFRWEKNRLYYDLIEDCRDATVYTIKVRSSAEDKNGNNLTNDASSSFSVGSDLIRPVVISINPPDGSLVDNLTTPIVVTFSEPVRLESLYRGFSLSPYVSGNITLSNDGTICTFTPYDPYIHGILYTLTLSNEICDIADNHLLERTISIFKAGTDFVNPTLNPDATNPPDSQVGVFALHANSTLRLIPFTLNSGVDKYANLSITFSKAMQRLDTQKSISISPFVEYTIKWVTDKNLQLIPSEQFALQQQYTISISRQAKDIAGNALDRDYSFLFFINGENSLPIEIQPYGNPVKYLYQMPCSGEGPDEQGPIRILENDDIINSAPPYYFEKQINGLPKTIYILRIVFNNKNNTLDSIGINLISSLQNVSFTVQAGNVITSPKIWKISKPQNKSNALDIYLFDLEKNQSMYYKISITHGPDGIKDNFNNYMLTPFTLFLNY